MDQFNNHSNTPLYRSTVFLKNLIVVLFLIDIMLGIRVLKAFGYSDENDMNNNINMEFEEIADELPPTDTISETIEESSLIESAKLHLDSDNIANSLEDNEKYGHINSKSQQIDNGYTSSSYAHEEASVAVEQMAEFPGGQVALHKWLSDNIHYPEEAQENDIQGRVIVRFIVEKDGSISNALVVRGVEKSLDTEAVRVVKKMPKWKPARNNGEIVRSYYNQPITFKLTDDN